MAPQKRPQSVRGNQVVATSQESPQPDQRAGRKDVLAPNRSPDLGELSGTFGAWAPRYPGGVDGTDRGSDQDVGDDAPLAQGEEHSDLNRPETAPARQHEGCAHRMPPFG